MPPIRVAVGDATTVNTIDGTETVTVNFIDDSWLFVATDETVYTSGGSPAAARAICPPTTAAPISMFRSLPRWISTPKTAATFRSPTDCRPLQSA